MKPILFLLNDRESLKLDGTNITLMKACLARGNPVYLTDVVHLQASGGTDVFADSLQLPDLDKSRTSKSLTTKLSKAKSSLLRLRDLEAVFIRTTPGKDIHRAWAHRLALEVMGLAFDMGVNVVNKPAGLQKASSKLYTVCLPEEFVPRTLVCHTLPSVQAFAEELNGPLVIKPLLGSQGRDVFFFDGVASLNTRQVVDILGRTGYLVVQEYLQDAADGDIRVLTLDGSIVGSKSPMGIRRTPADGEMRSNVSLGGRASVVELSQRQTDICNEIAGHIHRDGIHFSGLDLIGEKVVEVNVFSPSGLQEYDRQFGEAVSANVVDQLLVQQTITECKGV